MLSMDNPTQGYVRAYGSFPGILQANDIEFKLKGEKDEWDFFTYNSYYKAHRYRLFNTYEEALNDAMREAVNEYSDSINKATEKYHEAVKAIMENIHPKN